MDTKTVVMVALILILAGAVTVMGMTLRDNGRIVEIQEEVADFEELEDSLRAVIAERDAEIASMRVEVATALGQAEAFREALAQSDTVIFQQRLAIRMQDSFDAVESGFQAAFPLISERSFITDHPPDPEFPDITFKYYMIPAGTLTTFADNKQTLDELQTQREICEDLDQTNQQVISTQSDIMGIMRDNRATLEMAFDTASVLYKARSDELIEELRKPKFGVGLGSGLAGGLLIGVLTGALLGN